MKDSTPKSFSQRRKRMSGHHSSLWMKDGIYGIYRERACGDVTPGPMLPGHQRLTLWIASPAASSHFAGGMLHSTCNLIHNALANQCNISDNFPDSFLELARCIPASSGDTFLTSPKDGSSCGCFKTVSCGSASQAIPPCDPNPNGSTRTPPPMQQPPRQRLRSNGLRGNNPLPVLGNECISLSAPAEN